MTGYSYSMPICASRPPAIELSTGLTDDACTRTSTSLSAGTGAGRSSRRAGAVSGRSRVTPRMAVWSVVLMVLGLSRRVGTQHWDRRSRKYYSVINDLSCYIVLMASSDPAPTAPPGILDEH